MSKDAKLPWPEDKVKLYTGCSTRQAILIDKGKNITRSKQGCSPVVGDKGGWADIYGTAEGNKVDYEPMITNSKSVDIDHVVPLKEVWRSGGWKLDEGKRRAIANDYINLVPTTAKTNRSKSDQSAATYLPPSKFRCYVTIKDRYGLEMTKKEHERLVDEASKCGELPLLK